MQISTKVPPISEQESGSPAGATYLADTIAAQGAGHVFFVDAVLRETLVELEKRGVQRILAHSEKAAAYMADGYARASGRSSFVMAQSVGAANLAAGLQDAYLDRVPIVALTGRKPDSHQHRNAYQEVDHAPLYTPVTKFRAQVRTSAELPRLFSLALREAQTPTRRPCHLDLDGLKGDVVEAGPVAQADDWLSGEKTLGRAADTALAHALKAIATAKRPMIVCGVDSLYRNAGPAVLALAHAIDAPVATSVGGRSVIPTSDPYHFGVVGTYSAPYANAKLAEADLVIFVGCHMGDQVSCDWTLPAQGTPIIQIDEDPAEIGRTYPGAIGLAGDLNVNCGELAAGAARSAEPGWRSGCVEVAAAWMGSAITAARGPSDLILAPRLAHEVGAALPEAGMVVADTGFSATWAAQYTAFDKPDQTFLRAAGSLGWAFPAAIGAALARGEKAPTICFTGDGAFYYHIGELETAKRWNVPLVTVVNNNSALGQGLRSVKRLYEGRPGKLSDLIGFEPVDFAALARVFGIDAIRVTQAEDIAGALQDALSRNGPVLVDVVTDPDSNPEPAWRL